MKHNFLTFVKETAMWYTYNYYNNWYINVPLKQLNK